MTDVIAVEFCPTDANDLASVSGRLALLVDASASLDPLAQALDDITGGSVARAVKSEAFSKLKPCEALTMSFPSHLAADALVIVKMPATEAEVEKARLAGASLAKLSGPDGISVLCGARDMADQIAFGLALRHYEFRDHKTTHTPSPSADRAVFMVDAPEECRAAYERHRAVAEGVFFTRDLTNMPANVLTTTEFANQLSALTSLGLKVEVLEEDQLQALGMRALLSVGQGSDSPSKVVVMEWNGGAPGEKPFAFVGKGVVFDAGGISLKPGPGMEEMAMDMGGAGVVAGVMKTLALRKAKANVVGLVGLAENMPSGSATRPGDVIVSMKGDTIEVVNTDAEGRMVLADVLWYVQNRYDPKGCIDLATLTGAMIVGLGHENAGVFCNDDSLSAGLLAAAAHEGEGAWPMPLDDAYSKLLKSRVADVKNVGGRAAGAVTAAKFLQRFIKEGMPWAHIDIAGVAFDKTGTDFAPNGATGWGVCLLDRLIADRYEGEAAKTQG